MAISSLKRLNQDVETLISGLKNDKTITCGAINVDKKYRPSVPTLKNPPFRNGRFFEEYFFDFWKSTNITQTDYDRFHYIEIFWLNIRSSKPKTPNTRFNKSELEKIVFEECRKAKTLNKIPFTLCQWADNIGIKKPDNLIVYSIGTKIDVALPLLVEDKTSRLLSTKRIDFINKKYLCSFVGTFTHSIRKQLYNTYKNNKNFNFATKNSWTPDVKEDLVKTFIDITQYSKFALAPRGYGVSSFRFFEIMQMGVIPIYIHNDDRDNGLPFLDEPDLIDYSKFSIVLKANEIPKLVEILEGITEEKYNEMQREVERMNHFFSLEESCKYVLRNLRRRYEKSH